MLVATGMCLSGGWRAEGEHLTFRDTPSMQLLTRNATQMHHESSYRAVQKPSSTNHHFLCPTAHTARLSKTSSCY